MVRLPPDAYRLSMRSYEETLEYIFNLRGGEIDLRLQRVEDALALFDHPERRFRSFHIAGTNGKGSTAAMLQRILCVQGYRTGLYISPHVASFSERMRVGEREISPQEVVGLAALVEGRVERAGIGLTFFEFVTVMAFAYFAWSDVEVAVVEVGMGGRLDATNVVRPEVSLITTIAKDHEAYLGFDLGSIAREKGGIIKAGVPLVAGALAPEADGVLKEMARANGARGFFLGQDFSVRLKNDERFDYTGPVWRLADLELALRGRYQRANAAVALAALEAGQRSFAVSEGAVREGLRTVSWPGRFEIVCREPTVILDGAHNDEGIATLVSEIRYFQGDKKVRVLFAAMADKDWPRMLEQLATVASEIVLTRAPMPRSADPERLAAALPREVPRRIVESPVEAAQYLRECAAPTDTIVVAGSLYLLGSVRPWLLTQATPAAATKGKPAVA